MSIPYGRHSVNQDDIEAVTRVLQGDWLTTGPAIGYLETALTSLTNSSGAVAVSSGTAALHAGYRAIGIGKGDEVITSPLTFIATASTAIAEGAKVVFSDIEEDTGNIDPKQVASLVTSRTKAIAGVDFAGHPIEIDELKQIAQNSGSFFLEDAAHSIGSTYKGRPVGFDADVTAFSFFPTKNLTSGEGGALVSNHPELIHRARKFRAHGLIREKENQRFPDEGDWHQEVHEFGLNYRIPDILAALGSSQLQRLDVFKAKRTAIFNRYQDALADVDELQLPVKREYVDPMWHLFPIRVRGISRKKVFDSLRSQGIMVQVNYLPVYLHPVFLDMGYKRGLAPRAEKYYEEEISLPMFVDLTIGEQDRVIDILRQAILRG